MGRRRGRSDATFWRLALPMRADLDGVLRCASSSPPAPASQFRIEEEVEPSPSWETPNPSFPPQLSAYMSSALARMIDSALAGGAGLTRLPSGHGPDGYR